MKLDYFQLVAKAKKKGVDFVHAVIAADDLHLLRDKMQSRESYEEERQRSYNLIAGEEHAAQG